LEYAIIYLMKKILFIVLDGLGDEPILELGEKTPLESAETPFMDELARQGVLGLAQTKFQGALPTSEEGHLCLFGYDPEKLAIRRGLFTARGAGLEVKPGDVCLRGNFAYVKDGKAVDRRAGRIKKTKDLIKALNVIKIDDAEIEVKSAKEHRLGIVIRGQGLSPQISDSDCWYSHLDNRVRRIRPLVDSPEAEKTAEILNQFLNKAHRVLEGHPKNNQRVTDGLPPANYVITRGASSLDNLQSFQEKYGLKSAAIAGKFLYQQVAELIGMELVDVTGADGTSKTNLSGKFDAALAALQTKDFVFLHIKATDSLAEDGKFIEKRDFIERVDREMQVINHPDDTLVVITCDHSTCSLLKRHCDQPCPVLIWGAGADKTTAFSEKQCADGVLDSFSQLNLMSKIIELK
jgi:2,3-bisphosphoglycerate-independent phosphoglycerate mutase